MTAVGRAGWGARYPDGGGSAPLPARQWWLHHSVTLTPDVAWVDADGDHVDDDEERAMRTLEDIGQQRFGQGISYTWLLMPSGRVYVGHSMGRLGAHTAGRNGVGRALCLVGDYDAHQPTDAQLSAAAQVLVDEHRAGRAVTHRLNGGHRDLKATACPGRHGYAAIAEINRRADRMWASPTTPAPAPAPGSDGAGRPSLTYGMRNHPGVAAVQRFMAARFPLYARSLPATGNYLDQTVAVIAEFQRRKNITGPDANGRIIGPRTWAGLFSEGFRA